MLLNKLDCVYYGSYTPLIMLFTITYHAYVFYATYVIWFLQTESIQVPEEQSPREENNEWLSCKVDMQLTI